MFSVVVPVFNKRHTLRRTIGTVFDQTFADFEIVVVDDGSTDGSLTVIEDITDPRLRIVSQANAGPGGARNRGAFEARHAWVAFLDADDLWLPSHLAELDRVRARYPYAGLIGTRFATSDRRGRFRLSTPCEAVIGEVCLFDGIGRGEPLLFISSAAARVEVLRAVGGFGDYPRGEDSELWGRIALDYPVARSTAETVVYMHGTGGVTDTIPKAWGDGPPQRIEDLSPAVALLVRRLPDVVDARTRSAIEIYIERYLDWTLRSAVATRDSETLSALRVLYRRPPPALHRLALTGAGLAAPLALGWAAAILRADALRRKVQRAIKVFSSVTGPARAAAPVSRSAE